MIDKRKNPIPWMLIGGGILLILAGFVWVIVNQQAAPDMSPTPASVEGVRRVSLVEAKSAFDAGTAVFLDVRDSSSYNVSHIPGALLIPLADLPTRMDELNQASWIIPYCT